MSVNVPCGKLSPSANIVDVSIHHSLAFIRCLFSPSCSIWQAYGCCHGNSCSPSCLPLADTDIPYTANPEVSIIQCQCQCVLMCMHLCTLFMCLDHCLYEYVYICYSTTPVSISMTLQAFESIQCCLLSGL